LENDQKYHLIQIKGLVQGVGFRPFINRIASRSGIQGWVINRNDGVLIKIQGTKSRTEDFCNEIMDNCPPASEIHKIKIEESTIEEFDSFRILESESVSDEITLVSPDIAVCADCLEDMQVQKHRIDYPFINCTNCGPRFSIIQELPYDRPKTTMSPFIMCSKCRNEYENILDRRYHAQPVACMNCGPEYTFMANGHRISGTDEIIKKISAGLDNGAVYAMKGIGGFHLMCDALNDKAVDRIRDIKNREGKPFALMAGSIEMARLFAHINDKERSLLESWKRPIVILKRKSQLAESACSSLDKIGIMLPYMPFHHLLFSRVKTPALVMTSGNISDEPIVISNKIARKTFVKSVDGIIDYNRDIHNRVDDSLVKVSGKRVMMLRRSRGYAPSPIIIGDKTEGILATGAELVNSFCIGKGDFAIMSQYIGDLKDLDTLDFFEESYKRYCKLFRFSPSLIVADMHPDYLSTVFALRLSGEKGIPLIRAQHHHSHIVSVMAEQKIKDERVIGVSFDGLGAGYNNEIWGGEVFIAGRSFARRRYFLKFMPLPGSDRAAEEPWRMALSYLRDTGLQKSDISFLPVFQDIRNDKIKLVEQMIKEDINCPKASSAGRLFDAVSAITGTCYFNTFQAEAPMRLESIIDENEEGYYNYDIRGYEIDFNPMVHSIVMDMKKGQQPGKISARFHNTIIRLIVDLSEKLRSVEGLNTVVLSGGTFQNSYLCENTEKSLQNKGFIVYLPESVPANDQGIALGQLGIAAELRKLGLSSVDYA
jgi:hydrogenase maturation protein HypF